MFPVPRNVYRLHLRTNGLSFLVPLQSLTVISIRFALQEVCPRCISIWINIPLAIPVFCHGTENGARSFEATSGDAGEHVSL